MVVEWYKLPIADPVECRTLVNNLLKDDSFLSQTVELGAGPRTSWFTVEEIVKLVRAYFFANERSLGCKPYTQKYFSPLRWPTVLLVCTALRCALMDYEDTGHKSLAVGDFSQAVFGEYYKRYYQTYQKMAEARKNATIRKIDRHVQKIRSQHETERIETAGYEDEMGDDPGQVKGAPEITGTREVWTRDRWDRGSVDQDRRPRVRVKRLDLGAGWWTKRFKGTGDFFGISRLLLHPKNIIAEFSMPPNRGRGRVTTTIFRTELNLTGEGRTVEGRRYRAVRTYILQKCNERNITSRTQAGDTLWNEVRTETVAHIALRGSRAIFNPPQNGQHRAFHVALDALIIDVLKMAAESRRNARLNSDAEEEGGDWGAGGVSGSGSRDERAVARPQPTVLEEKPVRIIFISTTGAERGQARQLPWINLGNNAMPNKSWLVVLRHYTLQQLGEAAWRQVNAWLRLSQCSTLTVACFLHQAAVAPPDGRDPVRPNKPLVGHSRNYLFSGQFDVAEFYTEPESDSDEEDNVECHARRRRAFPRSHNGWQRRILSNDFRIVRFQTHSRELISRARVRQGSVYMSQYVGQDVPMVALPPGIPPPGCVVSVHDAIEEGADDNCGGDGGNGGNGGNA
ncbi:hypothetical protein B9Z19DRAFT_1139310 [Tuber borchii]|uniref:Uncharacterized protein n=1 Tax=Tuber borchii TaxID=42251 RepID=A0A2T6Z9N8_TUBBO|nr:hypothetical protein B9Z19DRAFT_1139310 [Tuber borchii]